MAEDLVTVGNFQFLAEAEAARTNLAHQGIQAFLSDVATVNADWLLGNAIGYIKLQVNSAEAEAAVAVLEHMRAKQSLPEDRGRGKLDLPICLSCGAEFSESQES